MPKKVTITDIAKQAGTSTATVSRVLSASDYHVTDELRNTIQNTAEKLGYIYTPRFSKCTQKEIGVVLPTLSNPFYFKLLSGIESTCYGKGLTPVFCGSQRNPDRENELLTAFAKKSVEGIILSSVSNDHTLLKSLIQIGLPIVVFDQSVQDLGISYVKFDYFEAGRLAVEYLYLKGHRKIGFASPPINRPVRQEALNGYLYALESFSVAPNSAYVVISETENECTYSNDPSAYDFENGRYLAKKIIKLPNPPTAVFTINDMTALGMITEFSERGISVPDDISVIGFDDIELSAFSNPPLTTIRQPAYEIGRLTAKILIRNIVTPDTDISRINLRPSIVERESVANLY